MSHAVRIVERARTDVDSIFDWLSRRSIRGAIAWYLAFGQAIEKVRTAPEAYGRAPESERLQCSLHQAFFKTRRGRRYRIIFQMIQTTVVVLRVRGPGQAPLRRRDVQID